MKNIIIVLFCTGLLFTGCANAIRMSRTGEKEPITTTVCENISAIAGFGMANITGGKSWDPRLGSMVGAETKLHKLSQEASINTGINFSFQGANYTETYEIDPYGFRLKSTQSADGEFSGTVTLTYINIPFLYYYKCNAGFYGEIGIQPSFLISAKDKPEGGDGYDFKDYINTFDIGIPIGAGYKINEQLSIGARAVFGLTNINSDGTEMYTSDDTDRNFLLFATVSYKFYKNK